MHVPKVTVVVPVYKVAAYIERCARSLFEQTLSDIEYVFVDDCSPDNSIEILEETLGDYPERQTQVRIVHHQKNLGLASARNTGIKEARGHYIAHCDSDDWVDTTMYEQMYLKAVQTNSDIVGCDYFMHFTGYITRCSAVDENDDKIPMLKTYITSNWSVIWNLLVHRDLYLKHDVSGYPGLNFGEDYGLSVRLMYYANKYTRLNIPLYHYNRENMDSIVHKANTAANILKTTDSVVQINMNITDFFNDKSLQVDLLEQLSWRMLAGKRGWLYFPEKWALYREVFPQSNKYIKSNPFCSKKDKLCQTLILIPALAWIIVIVRFVDTFIKVIKRW